MKESMTSRERVLAALEHRPVDRYPIDLGFHWSTGINGFAYYDIREYLGLPCDSIEIPVPTDFLARADEDILDRFHIDTQLLFPPFPRQFRWNPRGKYSFMLPETFRPVLQKDGSYLVSGGGRGKMIMPVNGYFFDGEGFDYSQEGEERLWNRYVEEAERIYYTTDRFTMYMNFGGYYMGDISFLCDMLTEPEPSLAKIRELHEVNLRLFESVAGRLQNLIQGITIGGDLGTQTAPLLDPRLYEKAVHPYMKDFVRHVKQFSDYKVFMHSCGAVREFIPYFIEEGIDALNPVQVSAAGMEPKALKRDFGDKIAFWGGGCDTQRVLNFGTPQEVRENVFKLTDIFKQGSGFVFNQVHNIMGDIPARNIVAMLDAAYENSFYEQNTGAEK